MTDDKDARIAALEAKLTRTKDEAKAVPTAALCLTAGLGLAFPERDYLVWDPFDGERDTGIRCQQTTLRRARQRWTCFGLLGEQDHEIQPGDLYRHEKGFVDGRWGCYRLCIGCMDKWLTEIGRTPAAALGGGTTGRG